MEGRGWLAVSKEESRSLSSPPTPQGTWLTLAQVCSHTALRRGVSWDVPLLLDGTLRELGSGLQVAWPVLSSSWDRVWYPKWGEGLVVLEGL